MRVLHIDIDSLRPDHLGCYGYPRDTSPNIDALAGEAVRFENCYASDVPCLPSRTALWRGQFGYRTGVISHGGTAAQPRLEGPARSFQGSWARSSWMGALRQAGWRTVSISSFGDRHGAWHWYAGFKEIYDPGFQGLERADQVMPYALDWLAQNGASDHWFLHVNLWDPHTPYRTPAAYGEPFAGEPIPNWLTDDYLRQCWEGFGPHSAQEPNSYPGTEYARTAHIDFPRVPQQIRSIADAKRWIDGYDTGIHYADQHIGRLADQLADQGLLDETVIVISADHGENLGELNIWGDHQTADMFTCRVPLIVRWPGRTGEGPPESLLCYQFDWAATLLVLAGIDVPADWDATPFAEVFSGGAAPGRDYLVLSQGAWACQRAVRFNEHARNYLYMRTYHAGHKMLAPEMLFDLSEDPHQLHNLAPDLESITKIGRERLVTWEDDLKRSAGAAPDPLAIVLKEGGPFHTRGQLPAYLAHLESTGRGHHAEALAAQYPEER